jgi:hypothetical protein
VTHEEALHALEELAASPAARWIGNRFTEGGSKLLQKCMRCGAEETLDLPPPVAAVFNAGARGDALARRTPSEFDERLFTWKRAFQVIHERCEEVS